MQGRVRLIGALMMCAAAPALAQPDISIITGTQLRTCTNSPAVADYGPVERFDGLYFSFIDGARFAPCVAGQACGPGSLAGSVDVDTSRMASGALVEAGWTGWGWYRLTFEGRRGRWRPPHPCIGETEEFVEVRGVLRVERLE